MPFNDISRQPFNSIHIYVDGADLIKYIVFAETTFSSSANAQPRHR